MGAEDQLCVDLYSMHTDMCVLRKHVPYICTGWQSVKRKVHVSIVVVFSFSERLNTLMIIGIEKTVQALLFHGGLHVVEPGCWLVSACAGLQRSVITGRQADRRCSVSWGGRTQCCDLCR